MFAQWINERLTLPKRLCADTVGKSDFSQLPQLPAQLIVDASAVAECDSAGIAALLWLLRQATQQNCQIVWQGFSPQLHQLLRLYNLDTQGLLNDAKTTD